MTTVARHPRRRYLSLFQRVAGVNALLLVAAVIVTVVVLAPDKFSSFAFDETLVLVTALALVAVVNLAVLRRVVRPLEALTALARRVDLSRPERLPVLSERSEAGELTRTFNEMLDRLETERREATGRVLAGQEAERLRIAQELHDQVGQELTAVLLGLSRVRTRVDVGASEQVGEIQEAVRACLEDVRRIALELRPEALDELGLLSSLAALCDRFAQRSGLTVEQRIDDHLPALDDESELVIYRVAQEALTNVARHSGAHRADLSLRDRDGRIVLEVRDAGAGLPPVFEAGTGMRGMRERAALIGATLDVGPGPGGSGCTVTLGVARSRQRPPRDTRTSGPTSPVPS
jgi:two-component system sensor histidine kinase UhpB